MYDHALKPDFSVEDIAVQRVESIPPDLLKKMKASRPNELYEKAHGYPVSVPRKWNNVDDQIIDWSFQVKRPLRFYVHIPWCLTKCTFCYYESKAGQPTDSEVQDYLNLLKKELEIYCGKLGYERLNAETLYIGGGTPSILSPKQIKSLFDIIHSFIDFQEGAFLITEVSPGSLTPDKIQAFVDGGINRISVGVQSFQDHLLKICRRDHDANKAIKAYDMLWAANIPEINFDLMLGLPEQTLSDFVDSVQKAIKLTPSSLTFLDLIVAKGSEMYKKGNYNPSWKKSIIMRAIYHEILRRDKKYERSRPHYYILPDQARARTTRTPYLDSRPGPGFEIGIGVTACSHLGDVVYRNGKDHMYKTYLSAGKLPVHSGLVLSKEDRTAMTAIRTIVDKKLIPCMPDVFLQYQKQIEFLSTNGLIDNNYNLTDDGCLFYEEILYMLYPPLSKVKLRSIG